MRQLHCRDVLHRDETFEAKIVEMRKKFLNLANWHRDCLLVLQKLYLYWPFLQKLYLCNSHHEFRQKSNTALNFNFCVDSFSTFGLTTLSTLGLCTEFPFRDAPATQSYQWMYLPEKPSCVCSVKPLLRNNYFVRIGQWHVLFCAFQPAGRRGWDDDVLRERPEQVPERRRCGRRHPESQALPHQPVSRLSTQEPRQRGKTLAISFRELEIQNFESASFVSVGVFRKKIYKQINKKKNQITKISSVWKNARNTGHSQLSPQMFLPAVP